MEKRALLFKWVGIILVAISLLLVIKNQNVKASGDSSPSAQSSAPVSAEGALLTVDDLPGFRQTEPTELVGYLELAKRITSGLASPQTELTNISAFQSQNLFRSESVISFLAYPLSENEQSVFDALVNNPQSILDTLTAITQASGNTETPRLLSELGDIGGKSMGFSFTLGQEPVAQNIDFVWARRGEIIQSTWVIYPIDETASTNLHQLGLLVNQIVEKRFPGTTFRPAGLLVPDITTHIPTPLDISTRPAVIGTNLLLAALMMLPFALAAEIFTHLSAEQEELLRGKFRPTRWLLALPRRFEAFLGARLKPGGAGVNILRLLLIIFFYGLAFSLLDRTWNPFSVTGLVLFLNMTVAYGVVGIADDIVQWRVLKKWGKPAEINLRPTNIFIAALSTITSRLLTLVPGLMFGTPEALILDETRLGIKRRNYLLKISAYTLLVIGLGLWALTTITAFVLRQNISVTLGNVVGGLEGFLLIVFAVALENTFVQMLGLPGSFGEALRKRSRWLWVLGLMCITFAFYHTLINPRGDLAAALQEANVWIFLGTAGAFVTLAFGLWAYLNIKRSKPAEIRQPGKKIIPAWVWLAVTIIGITVIADILITRHEQEVILAGNSTTPTAGESTPPAAPTPAIEANNEVELSFAAPVAIEKLCYVPSVNINEDSSDLYLWRGVQLAAAQYGANAEYLTAETLDEAGYTKAINQLMQGNCNLIVGNYSSLGQAIMNLAAGNPGQNFMLLSGGADLPNVWVTKYSLPEEAYFAGYLAAAVSRTGKVGTFGSSQIPNVVSSMNCFALGVNDYNKAQKTNVTVIGWDNQSMQGLFADGLMNPDQGTSLANDLISRGADIIFPMAGSGVGSTGSGTIAAAGQHEGVYVIGVDLDWAWAMPEFANGIVSSTETRYERSIAMAVDELARGEFHGGVHEGNLASGEIALSPLHGFSELVSSEVNDQMVHQSNPGKISAEMKACQISQNINGFLNLDGVGGANWPGNARLTIRIFASPGGALLFTGEASTEKNGQFFQGVGVDLVAGMAIEVDDGTNTRSFTLVDLTIDVIDADGDIVSGSAPGGTNINVSIGDPGNKGGASLPVTTDSNGHWQASFAGLFDITSKTVVQATAVDADGNGTAIKTNPY